ncbi:MAG: phospholipase D-like domain-containing protein [Xenococcaceae cyanobacterium]
MPFVPLIISWLFLSFLLFACGEPEVKSANLPQDSYIKVYFNHNQTHNTKYRDPYRQIDRYGDNLEAVIIKQIESAQKSIDLAVQELRLPNIAKALAKKQQQGITVRVIIDNKYNQSIEELNNLQLNKLSQQDRWRYQELFTLVDINQDGHLSKTEIEKKDALIILDNAKVPLIDDTADGSKGSGLMHHKFMVIDGQKVVTGSANFTLSGIHGDFSNLETRGNVNHLLVLDNRKLANIFTQEFNLMWGDSLGSDRHSKFGLSKTMRPPQKVIFGDNQVTVQFSPVSSTKNWYDTTNGLIGKTLENAHSSIDLALFVFSEQKLADILQKEQQKGVNIRGLFDVGFAFRYYSEALDLLGFALPYRCKYEENNQPWQKPLRSVGIPLLPRGDKLHHKFAIIDNSTVITGSQNWSASGNYNNDETVLIIQNRAIAAHFEREFTQLYQQAKLGLPQNISAKLKSEETKCY